MDSSAPIGIFDSGVGGLTAVRALQMTAPNESVVYFGDTARVPYGCRTKEDITQLSCQDIRFLRTHDLKAILIACNTITANCIDVLRAKNSDLPILGTIEPAAKVAAKYTKNKRIGIIATQATVNSGAYEQELMRLLPDVHIVSQACPTLVPLIESGHISCGDSSIDAAVAEYLAPIKAQDVDTVILGCTHYPLIRKVVQAYMGPNVSLVDSGGESAKALLNTLFSSKHQAKHDTEGSVSYYCSARLSEFEKIAGVFLNRNIHGQAAETDIEQF
ncbi:MAG: glutamate racemase [Bacillota bacterium]